MEIMSSRYAKKVYPSKEVAKVEEIKEQGQPEFGIKIFDTEGGKRAVSAKQLYENLGYKGNQFSRWSKKNIVNNPFAVEKIDWIGLDINVEGNIIPDYVLTLDMAKTICMMSRTEVGHKIRMYFIAAEKKLTDGSRMMTIWEYAKANNIRLTTGETSKKALLCKEICLERSIMAGLFPHPKYGFIHAFPASICEEAFYI
jgi:phage anti-repressor protein